eukprot:210448-Pelagomonas_calceolata.AAC.2
MHKLGPVAVTHLQLLELFVGGTGAQSEAVHHVGHVEGGVVKRMALGAGRHAQHARHLLHQHKA